MLNLAPGIKHKDVYLGIFDAIKQAMHSDQTNFLITSAHGHKYLMITIEFDGNYIDTEPMKAQTTGKLVNAYQAIFGHWKATRVVCPNWHVFDNEAPEDFKDAKYQNGYHVELVPHDMHLRNAAKHVMQTYKGRFITTLARFADDFPIQQWGALIPQVTLTLRLLQNSNITPKVSPTKTIIAILIAGPHGL